MSCDYWLHIWLLHSDKKSARLEELTFGQKKKKNINGKKNVRKTAQLFLTKAIDWLVILLHSDSQD